MRIDISDVYKNIIIIIIIIIVTESKLRFFTETEPNLLKYNRPASIKYCTFNFVMYFIVL